MTLAILRGYPGPNAPNYQPAFVSPNGTVHTLSWGEADSRTDRVAWVATPERVATASVSGVGSFASLAYVAGHAYLAVSGGTGGNRVLSYDARTDANLAHLATLSVDRPPLDMEPVGASHLLWATGNGDSVDVYDVSTPSSITRVGTLIDATYLNGVKALAVKQGSTARAVAIGADSQYVTFVDLSTLTAPARLGSVSHAWIAGNQNVGVTYGSDDIVVVGTNSGLIIIDASNPSLPVVIATSTLAAPNHARGVYYDAANKRLFAADQPAGRYALINMADPRAPVFVDSAARAGATSVSYQEGRLFGTYRGSQWGQDEIGVPEVAKGRWVVGSVAIG